MCNAYGLRAPVHKIAETFQELRIPLRFEGGAPNLAERDPIRPTETAPVVRGGPQGAELALLKWGFAPAREKRPPVINFRSEGRRFGPGARALVLASWFYEYTGDRSPKTRWRFIKSAGAEVEDPFAIAGLVRPPTPAPDGSTWPASFTMLTGAPGPDVAPIHDRQVLIIDRAEWAIWLSDREDAGACLRPSPAGTLAVTRA